MKGILPLVVVDALLIAVAYTGTEALRFFDVGIDRKYVAEFRAFLPVAVATHLAANGILGLYTEIWRHAGIQQARRIVVAAAGSGVVLYAVCNLWYDLIPQSVRVLAPVVTALFLGVCRFRSRLFKRRRQFPTGLRVLVIGTGESAAAIIRDAQRNPNMKVTPVAVLDNDTPARTIGMSVAGVRVVGHTSDLATRLKANRIDQVLFAVDNGSQQELREVASICDKADVPLRVVPNDDERFRARISLRDIREPEIEDLIGRCQVETDLDSVAALLAGKRILITGAGGSIGSEISRQVSELDPAMLLLLDHDETHLHDVASLVSNVPACSLLCDIRHQAKVDAIFAQWQPEVVFHAAAHKHVPLLENHPSEAFTTNVLGTRNVVDAATSTGVGCFVLISTDKAVKPTSVMGASKRVAENLVLARRPAGARYCAVRFGNVLGSRGSVIPTFERQIRMGGPVTVTHEEMERFFISTPEAVQLVLQAAAVAEGHDIFMLDMGEPMNILRLAQQMIRLAGYRVGHDIAIQITGPRPGEKLREQLRGPDEDTEPTAHPSIVRLHSPVLPRAFLDPVLDRIGRAMARGDEAEIYSVLLSVANAEAPLPV